MSTAARSTSSETGARRGLPGALAVAHGRRAPGPGRPAWAGSDGVAHDAVVVDAEPVRRRHPLDLAGAACTARTRSAASSTARWTAATAVTIAGSRRASASSRR